jgi:hypothetical protein
MNVVAWLREARELHRSRSSRIPERSPRI